MFEWARAIDIPSLIIGVVLGAFAAYASTWYGYYVKRPVLKTVGGGGGSVGNSFLARNIAISNPPGLLGLKIRKTILFGFKIHGRIENSLIIERKPARQCRAVLYDKETNRVIKHLWWRTSDGKLTKR